jgi:hypothetical protein
LIDLPSMKERASHARRRDVLRRAIEVAREQGARWWEVGALSSLVQILPSGTDRTATVRQLTDLHAAIDDGPDVPALHAVRTLLADQRA